MIKISVIIPVYNCKMYLRQCIESVINQDEKNIEIILVDDGSTDGSSSICEEYAKKDKRITFVHKKNEGVSVARNVGLKNAKGKYIAFVDADDYINPKTYSKAFEHMEKNNLDLLIWNYSFDKNGVLSINEDFANTGIVEDESGIKNLTATLLCPIMCDLPTKNNKIIGMGFPWNKLFKLDIIKKNNLKFTENIIMHEDVLFVYEYMKFVSRLELLNDSMYYYRINENGATLKYKSNIVESNNLFLNILYNEFDNMTSKQKDAFWSRVIRCYGNVCTYDLYHKENNNFDSKKINKILIEQPLYKMAIRKAKFKFLTKKQIVLVTLTRMKLFFVLKILLRR